MPLSYFHYFHYFHYSHYLHILSYLSYLHFYSSLSLSSIILPKILLNSFYYYIIYGIIYKKKGMIFMEYNRANAVAYAKKWAYGRNPKYYDFSDLGGDCTNFASQCIYAGSGVMNYTPTYGWYYISVNNRAPAWTGVDELYRFLTTNRGAGPRAILTDLSQIQNGDIIQLQFTDKERFDHSPVVVDAGNRTPQSILVAAHSYDADCRPLSSYRYIKIRPLHITNVGE